MKRFQSKRIAVLVIIAFLFTTVFYPTGVYAGYPSIIQNAKSQADKDGGGDGETCFSETACNSCAATGNNVSYFTGSERLQETDLVIPGRGLPLVISRSYHSKGVYNSFFGYGWDLSVNIRLYETDEGNYIFRPGDGSFYTFTYDSATSTYESPAGMFLTLDVSGTSGYPSVIINREGLKYLFTVEGLLDKLRDRNGNELTFVYDGTGGVPEKFAVHGRSPDALDPETPIIMVMDHRLSMVIDTVGREVNFSYITDSGNPNMGRLASIYYLDDADADGTANIYYLYDSYGNLENVIDQVGVPHKYGYFDIYNPHNLTHVYAADGTSVVTEREYDARGRVIKEKFPSDGSYHQMWYGESVAGTTPGCSLEFDGNPGGTSMDVIHRTRRGAIEILSFDAGGNLLERTNTMGTLGNPDDDVTTHFQYNSQNRPTRIIDPIGRVTSFEWNAEGDLTSATNPLGETTYIYYEDMTDYGNFPTDYHRIKEIDAPDGYQDTRFIYYDEDIMGVGGPIEAHNLKEIQRGYSDSLLFQTVATLEYNANGQVTKVKNILGKEIELKYDALANLTKLISPKNSDVGPDPFIDFTEYDNMGRLEEVQDPKGILATIGYDPLGRVLFQTVTPSGGGTGLGNTFVYNDIARNAVKTDANGIDNTLEVDVQSRINSSVLTLQGGGGAGVPNTVSFTPDISGAPASLTDPKGFVNNFGYDSLDRFTSTTRPNLEATSYVNDKASRLVRHERPDGSIISYQFDEIGRLTSRSEAPSGEFVTINYTGSEMTSVVYGDTSGSKIISYTYDELYRLKRVTYPTGDYVEYDYNFTGQITSINSSSGDVIAYDYYDDGSVKTVSKNGSIVATYTYTLSGQIDSLTRDNGTVTDYDYDLFGRLSRIAHKDGSVPFLAFNYTYDSGTRNNMMITSITRTEVGGSETTSYDYDDLYRLTSVTDDDGTTRAYSYDKNGNILSMEERDSGNVLLKSETYNYYLDSDPNHGKMNRVVSIEYDDDGVGGTDRTRLFEYDGRGNVYKDYRGAETLKYLYNSRNQVIEVQKDAGSGFVWHTSYEYDAFGRRTAKEAASGKEEFVYAAEDILFSKLGGSVNNKYIHGDGIDDIIMSEDLLGRTKYTYTDHLGSVVGIDTQTSRSIWGYNEWGVANTDRPTGIFPYGYISRELDEETDLYFIRARTYDPTIRRWYQEEPLGFLVSLNFYSYAANNPVMNRDNFGLQKINNIWVSPMDVSIQEVKLPRPKYPNSNITEPAPPDNKFRNEELRDPRVRTAPWIPALGPACMPICGAGGFLLLVDTCITLGLGVASVSGPAALLTGCGSAMVCGLAAGLTSGIVCRQLCGPKKARSIMAD